VDGSTPLGKNGHSNILSWINQSFDYLDIQPKDLLQRIARWKIKQIQAKDLSTNSYMESFTYQKSFTSNISELLNEYNLKSKLTIAWVSDNDILLKMKNKGLVQ
jgi:hypothetical protein